MIKFGKELIKKYKSLPKNIPPHGKIKCNHFLIFNTSYHYVFLYWMKSLTENGSKSSLSSTKLLFF